MNDFILAKFAALQAYFVTLGQDNGDEGATAVEYGMLVALIAAVIVGLVTTLGTTIRDSFQTIVDALT